MLTRGWDGTVPNIEAIMIKESIIRGIRRYADEHCPTGGFLRAVLSNDLRESCFRADDNNVVDLVEIVKYCHWEIPSNCWGSPEKVEAWLEKRPLRATESDDLGSVHTITPPNLPQYPEEPA